MLRLIAGDVKKQHTYGPSGGKLSSSQQSPLRQPQRSSAKSTARSSASSFGSSSPCTNSTSYNTPRSSWSHGSLLSEPPQTISEDAHAHRHWCTHRKHHNTYGTCDGWKRHMKEHETVFQCMPSGPLEHVGGIYKCAFCDMQDPSHSHLQEHHSLECTGPSNTPLTKSRKSNMVVHLATHMITGQAASVLADKWRCTLPKKAFSCGFCVTLFSTLGEQLNHIDNEHFARGQGMSEWNLDNVVRGLLLQPYVNDAWQLLLDSHPGLMASELLWDLHDAETLQFRLQMGERSGQDLASAALRASNHNAIDRCWDETKPVPISKEINVDLDAIAVHAPPAFSTMHTSALVSGWDQHPGFKQRDFATWNCESTPPDWSDLDPSLPAPTPSQTKYPQARPTFPNTPSDLNYVQNRLCTNSSSSIHGWDARTPTLPAAYDVFNPSLSLQSWSDTGFDPHMQVPPPAAGASLMDQIPDSGHRHPATLASAEFGAYQLPPKHIVFDETSVPLSPAACEASVMLRSLSDGLHSRQEKPLPVIPAPKLEIRPSSPMDFDFDYV